MIPAHAFNASTRNIRDDQIVLWRCTVASAAVEIFIISIISEYLAGPSKPLADWLIPMEYVKYYYVTLFC